MRTFWWTCIYVGVLIGAVAYQHFKQPSLPPGQVAMSEPHAVEPKLQQRLSDPEPAQPQAVKQKPEQPLVDSEQSERHAAEQKPEQPLPGSEQSERRAAEQQPDPPLPDAKPSELQAVEQKPEQLVAKVEEPMRDVAPAPAALTPDQSPDARKEAPVQQQARLEDAASAGKIERSEPNDKKRDLSYLAYYAYSELPPQTKPASIVLAALKDVPPGTPIEEIKLVSGVLGLDFTFMKAVARIESDFDPKQRTGSYIGLFQLSKHEFDMYGSGDILAPRDNTVAAALKFMIEANEFEMFTQRKPTLNDVYLVHQQGVDGAAEHVSHPRRLAWQSMCATDEGKQKGEKWCKRAIWGNTTPAIKRMWKTVNNVTSGAFVTMWQERVSHFYARYSAATAN